MFQASQAPSSLLLQQLCEMLQQAGMLIATEYHSYVAGQQFDIQHKSDDSPVTQADIKAHQFIAQQLIVLNQQLGGSIPLLSEEGDHADRRQWQTFWLLDPLDGTKEFINQTGEFTINLSLMTKGEAVISAIAVPMKQTVYIAQQSHVPFKYQWCDSAIHWSQYQPNQDCDTLLVPIKIAMSRRNERHALYGEFLAELSRRGLAYELVTAGSAYKFCLMLEHQVDVYVRFHPTSEWDTAAGQGLLHSIGGEVMDLQQRPLLYNQRDSLLNGAFIALRQRSDAAYYHEFMQRAAHAQSD